ncbi:MAG TPA: hypothetical protein VD793_00745, partial [Gemmatimonadales bacterium]|nr:hypothetical protein [Gemmatimonadales bacterium]
MREGSITTRALGMALVMSVVLTGCEVAGADGKIDGRSTARSTPVPPPDSYSVTPAGAVTPPVTPAAVTFSEAEALYHERRYAEAEDWFASYVVSKPDNAWGHY